MSRRRADEGEKTGKHSSRSFAPGKYVGETREWHFPYRVKNAKQPGQPLLVFFHGGGAAGTDNLRPLWEYLFGPYPEWRPLRKRRPLLRRDFTVLLPQSARTGNYTPIEYVSAVKDLCEKVAAEAQTDLTRVYCMGGSWGGRCAWLSAYLFPDFYACVLPMMGWLDAPPAPAAPKPEDLLHMKGLPIWVSHSADDPMMPVARDDEIVPILRSLGAPVKYTRVNGKGHRDLVPYFLKTEPWADWMFAQKKTDRQEGNNV